MTDLAPVRVLLARLDKAIAEKRQAFLASPLAQDELERVKTKLARMVEVDQLAIKVGAEILKEPRRFSKAQEDALHEALSYATHAVADAHAREVEVLVKRHGWFKIKTFGHAADTHGWLLVQHADHRLDLQKSVLATLDTLRAEGQTSQANYAYLWDRVAVNEGRRQRYGTQGAYDATFKEWRPDPVEDAARLDERRKSVGLEPLAAYAARYTRR